MAEDVSEDEGPEAIFDCQVSIADLHVTQVEVERPIGNWQSAIENSLCRKS